MNVENYKEFAVLARLLSYSKAAEELYIGQSTLSKHIASMESELGVQLLDRSSRKVSLSNAGRAMLPYANQIAETDEKIRLLLEPHKKRQRQHVLRVASMPIMAAYNITGTLADFHRGHPDIVVATSEYEPYSIPDLLSTASSELAFVRWTGRMAEQYEYLPYRSEQVLAVLPSGHALARRKCIPLEKLQNENLMLIGQQAELHNISVQLCRQAGFEAESSFSGLRPENMIDLVAQGMGVALLTENFYDYYKRPNTVGVAVKPTVSTAICLIRVRGRKLSTEAQLFWEYVEDLQPKPQTK